MATVSGVFVNSATGKAVDGATAKLWQASAFATPPEKNDALPGSGQVGSAVTTGSPHGSDGAYRFTNVAVGSYYISIEYNGNIGWEAKHVGRETVATSTDDVTVASLATTNAKFKGRPWFDIRAYGALGDGSNDDSAAISAAIAAAAVVSGTVYVPHGVHRIASPIELKSNVHVIGAGQGAILRAASAITVLSGTAISHTTIADLYVDQNQTVPGGAADADAILLYDSTGIVVRGCHITRTARDGIAFRGSSVGCGAIGNTITDSQEDGIILNGARHRAIGNYLNDIFGDGILLKAAQYCTVQGNTILNPGSGASAGGVSLGGDGADANDYNTIVGNTIQGASGASIFAANSYWSTIGHNTVKSGSSHGINANGMRDGSIEGNVIDDMDGSGIHVATSGVGNTSDRLAIIGNSITNSVGASSCGVDISSGTGHRVVGNTISTTGSFGVQSTRPGTLVDGNYITTTSAPGIKSTGADVTITNNRIHAATNQGIYHTDANGFVVSHNLITSTVGSPGRGIQLKGNQGVATGNHVRNSVAEGILVDASTDITFTGNRVYDDQGTKTQTYGIRSVTGSDWLVVVGNNLRGNLTSSVSLTGANNVNASNIT